MDKTVLDELHDRLNYTRLYDGDLQERGGYDNHEYDLAAYPDNPLHYDLFHYIKGETEVPPGFEYLFRYLHYVAESRRDHWLRENAWHHPDMGEICIRITWYPAQLPTMGQVHKDACFLTVPLFDSLNIRPMTPFYGELAEYYGYTALWHKFQADANIDRICIVAFCQADFDTEVDVGDGEIQRYGDIVTQLVQSDVEY